MSLGMGLEPHLRGDLAEWWSRLAVWLLILTVVLCRRALRSLFSEWSPRLRTAFAAVVALGAIVRLFVTPWGPMRAEYVAYAQLSCDLDLLQMEYTCTPINMPGRGVILELWDLLFSLSTDVIYLTNIAIGTLVVAAAFAVGWLISNRHGPTAIFCALFVALDPVHARFSASLDHMVLVGLFQWLALLGVLLHLRTRQVRGLALAATAAVACVFVKLDGAIGLVGILLLWVVGRRASGTDSDEGPLFRRAIWVASTAWVALSVGVVALLVQGSIYATDPNYLGPGISFEPESLLRSVLWENQFFDWRYASPFVPVMLIVAAGRAIRTLDREFLWIPFVIGATAFGVLASRMPAFYHHVYGIKGDLRWNFHVHTAWFTAAALGAGWVWSELPTPRLKQGFALLLVLALVPTADYWTHRWTYQREASFLTGSAQTLPEPCAVISPFAGVDVDFGVAPLMLTGLSGWPDAPLVHPDEAPDLSCAYYYEGLSCAVYPRGERTPGPLRPQCADVRQAFELEPIRTRELTFDPYSGVASRTSDITLGFYRLDPKAERARL